MNTINSVYSTLGGHAPVLAAARGGSETPNLWWPNGSEIVWPAFHAMLDNYVGSGFPIGSLIQLDLEFKAFDERPSRVTGIAPTFAEVNDAHDKTRQLCAAVRARGFGVTVFGLPQHRHYGTVAAQQAAMDRIRYTTDATCTRRHGHLGLATAESAIVAVCHYEQPVNSVDTVERFAHNMQAAFRHAAGRPVWVEIDPYTIDDLTPVPLDVQHQTLYFAQQYGCAGAFVWHWRNGHHDQHCVDTVEWATRFGGA